MRSAIDLSPQARRERIDAYHRMFLTVPVAAVSHLSSPSAPVDVVVETAATRAAGSTDSTPSSDKRPFGIRTPRLPHLPGRPDPPFQDAPIPARAKGSVLVIALVFLVGFVGFCILLAGLCVSMGEDG